MVNRSQPVSRWFQNQDFFTEYITLTIVDYGQAFAFVPLRHWRAYVVARFFQWHFFFLFFSVRFRLF